MAPELDQELMEELPEEAIDEAEGVNVVHWHETVSSEDGSLLTTWIGSTISSGEKKGQKSW